MDVYGAIHSRRSVREYTAEPVDEKLLRRLIDASIQAPSAINEQPWLFTVIRERQMLQRIASESKDYLLSKPIQGSASRHLYELLTDPLFDVLYHAPALVVISSIIQSIWAIENCTLAAENLMLAACAEELGTCWIGFAQPWLASPAGKEAIEIPTNARPVAPIVLGHPKSKPAPVRRKEPEIRWIGQ